MSLAAYGPHVHATSVLQASDPMCFNGCLFVIEQVTGHHQLLLCTHLSRVAAATLQARLLHGDICSYCSCCIPRQGYSPGNVTGIAAQTGSTPVTYSAHGGGRDALLQAINHKGSTLFIMLFIPTKRLTGSQN